MTSPPTAPLETLIGLSHTLAEPRRELVILAEGNTSVRTAPDRMLVKATGCSLAGSVAEDYVEIDLGQIQALIDDESADDDAVSAAFEQARVGGTKRASVEALLHAVCYSIEGVQAVGHTHPVSVNAILCSVQAGALVAGSLFPDQIVVLGTNPMLVGYHDPGLTLARVVAAQLERHVAETGRPPKVIYLQNHGMFALGASVDEVLQVTAMADKVARVLGAALAVGGAVYLTEEHVRRIDTRPDEEYRRAVLSTTGPTRKAAS